jgi:hypothetical protein
VHTSQVLSYLLGEDLHVGLLFNFNVGVLRSLRHLRSLRVKFLMS